MHIKHGPDLHAMTSAEREIILTDNYLPVDKRIIGIPTVDRSTVSKSAIKRARIAVSRIRQYRATLRSSPATTLRERLRSRLAITLDQDLRRLVVSPAAGRTVLVETGTPAIAYELYQTNNRYSGRRQFKMSASRYTITLWPGRTRALRAAGLTCGVADGRLILSAYELYADIQLTVLACITAMPHGKYGLRIEQDGRRGHIGPRISYLAVWRAAGKVEWQWHKSEAAALDSRPEGSAIREALAGTSSLTAADDLALSELAT
jgi:hypothetical protein